MQNGSPAQTQPQLQTISEWRPEHLAFVDWLEVQDHLPDEQTLGQAYPSFDKLALRGRRLHRFAPLIRGEFSSLEDAARAGVPLPELAAYLRANGWAAFADMNLPQSERHRAWLLVVIVAGALGVAALSAWQLS